MPVPTNSSKKRIRNIIHLPCIERKLVLVLSLVIALALSLVPIRLLSLVTVLVLSLVPLLPVVLILEHHSLALHRKKVLQGFVRAA